MLREGVRLALCHSCLVAGQDSGLWSRVGRGLPPRPALVLIISLPEDQHFPGGVWARSEVWQALSGWGGKEIPIPPLGV